MSYIVVPKNTINITQSNIRSNIVFPKNKFIIETINPTIKKVVRIGPQFVKSFLVIYPYNPNNAKITAKIIMDKVVSATPITTPRAIPVNAE